MGGPADLRLHPDAPGHLFTEKEANSLLPRLRPLLREAQDLKQKMESLDKELTELAPPSVGNGHARDAVGLRSRTLEMEQMNRRVQMILATVQDLGCEVKDLDMGLVDFRSMRNDREVYLCWTLDEPVVAFWHDLEGGYRGRQPL